MLPGGPDAAETCHPCKRLRGTLVGSTVGCAVGAVERGDEERGPPSSHNPTVLGPALTDSPVRDVGMKGSCEFRKEKSLLQAEPTNPFLNLYIDYIKAEPTNHFSNLYIDYANGRLLRGPSGLLGSSGQPAPPHTQHRGARGAGDQTSACRHVHDEGRGLGDADHTNSLPAVCERR